MKHTYMDETAYKVWRSKTQNLQLKWLSFGDKNPNFVSILEKNYELVYPNVPMSEYIKVCLSVYGP